MRTLTLGSMSILLALTLVACGDDESSNGNGGQDAGNTDGSVDPGNTDGGGGNVDDGGAPNDAGDGGGDPDPISCLPPEELCGASCANTDHDPAHCGTCDEACTSEQVCARGECADSCPTGTEECVADSRACNDLRTDRAHCGGCGEACEENEICANANCTACPGTRTRCGNSCENLQFDSENCGECGKVCPDGFQCSNGACLAPPDACSPACTLPDLCSEDGTCVSVSPTSCPGGCPGDQVCQFGQCVAACGQNLERCGDDCVVLALDTRHCGECNNPCGQGELCFNGECRAFGGGGRPDGGLPR